MDRQGCLACPRRARGGGETRRRAGRQASGARGSILETCSYPLTLSDFAIFKDLGLVILSLAGGQAGRLWADKARHLNNDDDNTNNCYLYYHHYCVIIRIIIVITIKHKMEAPSSGRKDPEPEEPEA